MEQKYNVRTKAITFLKENIRRTLHDLEFSMEFLDMTHKSKRKQIKRTRKGALGITLGATA